MQEVCQEHEKTQDTAVMSVKSMGKGNDEKGIVA
jgi:hypothetical protein